MRIWREVPIFVVLLALSALAMLPPAMLAYSSRDMHVARSFFYIAVLLAAIVAMLASTTRRPDRNEGAPQQLLTLFAAYTALPLVLALPFYEALQTTTLLNAYFEMVSSFTTTGATQFADPNRLSDALHFWRAIVGWLGGLFVWITAAAVLAPMNLGGFEVARAQRNEDSGTAFRQIFERSSIQNRISRHAKYLTPIYVALTGSVVLIGLATDEPPLNAVILAMSTLSTSGITLLGQVAAAPNFILEAAIFLFLLPAFTRNFYTQHQGTNMFTKLRLDPELKLAIGLLIGVSILLFFRHWSGAFDVNDEDNLQAALAALWGAFFTAASFLSTSGFESAWWEDARNWSGLTTPGLVLMALALMGGGVATTAGGIKLLRVYALYKHGGREMERLVYPSSLGRSGHEARRIRRAGAFIAWIFFMLFTVSLAAIMVLLSLFGVPFEAALIFSAAALTTTGPLAALASETPLVYASLPEPGKLVVIAAMVLGRLEALALIAVFNPAIWRR
ncbi:MAG: potassium transporter TrkG [Pseudomonadota bacterium]